MAKKHFRPRNENRAGYFTKEGDNPTQNYNTICDNKKSKGGYLGPKHEAHHILPGHSFVQSLNDINDSDKLTYIENVKWVTPWNINNENNLMGLPDVLAYMAKEQEKTKLAHGDESKRIKKRIKNVWNKYKYCYTQNPQFLFSNQRSLLRYLYQRWSGLRPTAAVAGEFPPNPPSPATNKECRLWRHLFFNPLTRP